MRLPTLCLWSILSIAAACGTARGEQPLVENPVYRNWKAFPVGSTATYSFVTESGSFREVRVMTYRLAQKSDSEIVVEIKNYLEGEDPDKVSPQRLTSKRLVRLPEGVKREDFGKRTNALAEGRESILAAGRQWDANWYVSRVKVEAGETESKTWSCPDVPGTLVKSINTTAATKSTTTIELTGVNIPGK